jgi:hypothetical protein
MFLNTAFIFSFSDIAVLFFAAIACLAAYGFEGFFGAISPAWMRYFLAWLASFILLLLLAGTFFRGHPVMRFEIVHLP